MIFESDADVFSNALSKFWEETDKENNASPQKENWGFLLHRDDGKVIGGIGGYTRWQWCYISNLIISREFRGKGYGEILVNRAENFAKEKNLFGLHLLTLSFQAPEFYKKMGFIEYGQLKNCPPGAVLHLLYKPLREAA